MSIAASVADVTAMSNRNTNKHLNNLLPSGRIPNSTPDGNTSSLCVMATIRYHEADTLDLLPPHIGRKNIYNEHLLGQLVF